MRRFGIASASILYGALLVVTRGRPTVDSDSGIFLTVAGRLLHGDRLYVDVFDNKDPLFFYVHAAALSIDWRVPFLLDVIWVALAAASFLLLLQAVGANRLTAWAGFACLPLLLTGKWYFAGFSMLAALSFTPLIGWLWLRHRFALAGASVCVGILFKINLALVLVSLPAAFLLLRTPPGRPRSQVARAAGGFGVVAAVAAAVMAIRGELHGYVKTMVDNVAYSRNVLGATGRPTGIPGHIRDAAGDVGSPLHFAVVAVIFLAVGVLAVRALRGGTASEEGSGEPTALRLLSAVFLVATVAVSVTLALTAAWEEHAQMVAIPGALLIALLVMLATTSSGRPALTVSAGATAALTLVLLGAAVGGIPGVRGSISSTWGRTGHSQTADLLEHTAGDRFPNLDDVTFAHLGQNDEKAVGAFLDDRFALACPSTAQYVFTQDLSSVLDCIREQKPRLILVTPSFRSKADAPVDWNRFVAAGSSLLHKDYELALAEQSDGGPTEVWELRTPG